MLAAQLRQVDRAHYANTPGQLLPSSAIQDVHCLREGKEKGGGVAMAVNIKAVTQEYWTVQYKTSVLGECEPRSGHLTVKADGLHKSEESGQQTNSSSQKGIKRSESCTSCRPSSMAIRFREGGVDE